jgi:hypothetical protein
VRGDHIQLQRRNDRRLGRTNVSHEGRSRSQQTEHVRRTWRREGYDGIGSRNRGDLRAGCIRVRAGWNVHGDHRHLAGIHDRDCLGVKSAYRRLETSAKDRIHAKIALQRKLHPVTLQLFDGMHRDCRGRQLAKHISCVSPQISRRSQQDHLNLPSLLMQPPRRHKPVAPVVSFAAKKHHAPHRSMVRKHIIGDCRTGVFHERGRRHTETLAGGPVNGSHFICGNDLHGSRCR